MAGEDIMKQLREEDDEMCKQFEQHLQDEARKAFERKKKICKWPFATMAIDDVVTFAYDENGTHKKAQNYAHTFAGSRFKRFTTKTIVVEGKKYMAIKRVE